MNSFICKKNLMPCPTPGMCAPHSGCPGVDVEAGKKLVAENDRLFKLLERMIDQMLPVEEMKDLPGYSRVLTAEALLAERDQLKAENEALREDLEHARRQPLYSTRRAAARYQHIKSTWHDGGLIDRLAANVLPEDWDAAIDADMGKEKPL